MPSSHTPPTTRLSVLIAREAPVAVILRRGPSKQVRLYRWDLQTNSLEGGQWLSGRVYEERCDLSPNGRLFVYFAGKFKGPFGTFTAVSRPPYFTALALWPEGSTYGGGGYFESDGHLLLGYGHVLKAHPECSPPASFRVGALGQTARPSTWQMESGTRWAVGAVETWAAQSGRRVLRRRVESVFAPGEAAWTFAYTLAKGAQDVSLGVLDWAGWDHQERLIVAKNGCLWRESSRPTEEVEEGAPGSLPGLKRVADFTSDTFTNIAPPDWARRWPG